MDSKRSIQTESLTKGCYHLKIATEYFEDFKRTCRQDAKLRAGSWVNKLSFVQTDTYAALTPASRERYLQEITNGDVLFSQSISEIWIQLTPQQREILEQMGEAMLSGEEIKIEKVPETTPNENY